jgi:hypothetical protein
VSEVPAGSGRLDGWKEIATYLRRDVRTVQRWEKTEGLPIHRHQHQQRAVPYAFARELDEWRSAREPIGERHVTRAWLVASAAVMLGRVRQPFLLPPAEADRSGSIPLPAENHRSEPVFVALRRQRLPAWDNRRFDVVPAERVRNHALGPTAKEHLTEDQPDARRGWVKAFVGGSIAALGSHCIVTIHVRECIRESIAREQIDVEKGERVLHALGDMVSRLRAKTANVALYAT